MFHIYFVSDFCVIKLENQNSTLQRKKYTTHFHEQTISRATNYSAANFSTFLNHKTLIEIFTLCNL